MARQDFARKSAPKKPKSSSKNTRKPYISIFMAGFAAGVLVLFAFNSATRPEKSKQDTSNPTQPQSSQKPQVSISKTEERKTVATATLEPATIKPEKLKASLEQKPKVKKSVQPETAKPPEQEFAFYAKLADNNADKSTQKYEKYLQAASVNSYQEALDIAKKLEAKNLKSIIIKNHDDTNKLWYRVVLGPFYKQTSLVTAKNKIETKTQRTQVLDFKPQAD